MKKFFFILLAIIALRAVAFAENGNDKKLNPEIKAQAQEWMRNQPVHFLENKGQMADMEGKPVPYVLYKASAPGMDMYITEKGLMYVFINAREEEYEENALTDNKEEIEKDGNSDIEWCRIDMSLKGASIRKENILKETSSATDYNYFYPHCSDGIYGVKQYEKITVRNIYPNIDWVLYNVQGKGFKYDFIVHPGADPKQIELVYCSKEPLAINSKSGNIELQTELGSLTESAPVCFQNGTEIPSRYIQTLNQKNDKGGYDTHIKFEVDNYDNTQTLIIDPLTVPNLVWGTYYGGNRNEGVCSIATDAAGNVFLTGYTGSVSIPTLNPSGGAYFQPTHGSAPNNVSNAFILKFSSTGALVWATYYGGTDGLDEGRSIAIDINGNVFITGVAHSADFPTLNLPGAYNQPGLSGGSNYDAFILKFNNNGVRQWATYYGGTSAEYGHSITTDLNGNVFITGYTSSGSSFPTFNLAGSYWQPANAGGEDLFILKFNNVGVQQWATFYGGGGSERGNSITTDATGNVFVTGETNSPNFTNTDFPTQTAGGAYFQAAGINLAPTPSTTGDSSDAFILKFTNAGVRQWATLYGGARNDRGYEIATDANGNIFVTGVTTSINLPTLNLAGAFWQPANAGGNGDIFILKFDNAGVRQWATYYGGTGHDSQFSLCPRGKKIVVDASGDVFITGYTASANFPTLPAGGGGYYQATLAGGNRDVFILQFSNVGVRKWATLNGSSINATPTDFGTGVAVDPIGCLLVVGEWTSAGSNGILSLAGAYNQPVSGGIDDSFIMKFCPPVTVLSLTASSTNIPCKGPCNGTATAAPSGGTLGYTYLWSPGGQTTQITTGLCAGSYTVLVTDATGGTATATVSITDPPTALVAGIPTVVTISCHSTCNGTATASATGGAPAYTYSWSTSPVQNTITATGLCPGTYTVLVTDANGCTSTSVATMPTSIQPVADFNSTPTISCEGMYLQFADASANALTWNWNVVGVGSSTAQNPGFAFPFNGIYNVILVVTNPPCDSTISKSVTIGDMSAYSAMSEANVFTPNGDTHNDCFFPVLVGSGADTLSACVELEVFDRWGVKMFESVRTGKCWNGNNMKDSKPAIDGTYYYIAKLGKTTIRGYVTLARNK